MYVCTLYTSSEIIFICFFMCFMTTILDETLASTHNIYMYLYGVVSQSYQSKSELSTGQPSLSHLSLGQSWQTG